MARPRFKVFIISLSEILAINFEAVAKSLCLSFSPIKVFYDAVAKKNA
jgi:hypothetical protein